MTAESTANVAGSPLLVHRWGPWLLGLCGLALTGVAVYHLQRYHELDAEIRRKVAEMKQAQEALRRAAADAGNNPAGALIGAFAMFGGSPEVDALAIEREHHSVRFQQFGGPGVAAVVAGLVWGWVIRRLRRAGPIGAPGRKQRQMAIAAGIIALAAAGLFLLHLHASNVSWDEAAPVLAPWWLGAAGGFGFAVYRARARAPSAVLFAAVLAVLAVTIGALYASTSDVVGLFLGFGESTADEDWYLVTTLVVALAAILLLRLATPRGQHNNGPSDRERL